MLVCFNIFVYIFRRLEEQSVRDKYHSVGRNVPGESRTLNGLVDNVCCDCKLL